MEQTAANVKHAQNLYVRRNGAVKGPYRLGLIRNFLLLGRLHLTDEVSEDQRVWVRLDTIDALIPKEMRADASDADKQRLQVLRRRQDEREKERRGKTDKEVSGANRRGSDRRQPEPPEVVTARELRLKQKLEQDSPKKYYFSMGLMALAAIGVGFLVYFFIAQKSDNYADVINCNAAPQPRVNWRNCILKNIVVVSKNIEYANLQGTNLQGADLHGSNLQSVNAAYAQLTRTNLSYVDLSNARLTGAVLQFADLTNAILSNADLSYADLKGALLGGVDLRGVKFDGAIWVDGKGCKIGSVGECVR